MAIRRTTSKAVVTAGAAPSFAVKYLSTAPKTLRKRLDANADKVCEFDSGSGYTTESGFAYDILLREGWQVAGEFSHTINEETVADVLLKLALVVPCDCKECRGLLQTPAL